MKLIGIMNKTLVVLALAASLAAGGCTQKHTITIANPADVAACGEMAQVPLQDVLAKVGDRFVITDAAGAEVPYQVTYDSLVIFPVTADAASEVVYTSPVLIFLIMPGLSLWLGFMNTSCLLMRCFSPKRFSCSRSA